MGLYTQMLERSRSRTGGSRQKPTLPELQAKEAVLRELQQATGAPEINRDEPGFFARTIDVLSGFNYAVAGAYEELERGGDMGAALSRAGRELFSSFQSLPFGGFGAKAVFGEVENAQKRAFGEVLEGLGYGTTTLGDVFPALEGSFFGELINTRGTAGLALDILTDPLTYISFGTSAARKVMFRDLGEQVLSRGGKSLLDDEVRALRKAGGWEDLVVRDNEKWLQRANRARDRGAMEVGDPFGEVLAAHEMEGGLRQLAFKRVLERHGEKAVLDQGGIKLFGRSVVEGETIKTLTETFGRPVVDIAAKVPGVRHAFDAGSEVGKWFKRLFDDFPGLSELGPNTRRAIIDIQRKYVAGTHNIVARRNTIMLGSEWFAYLKAHPEKQQKIVTMLQRGESAMLANLTPEELKAARGLAAYTEEMGKDLVALGILTPDQLASKGGYYFPNTYLNDPADFEGVVLRKYGRRETLSSGGHDQGRVFETMEEASVVSNELADMVEAAAASGQVMPPVNRLVPNYDVEDVLLRYNEWYAKEKAKAFFVREIGEEFGTTVTEKVSLDRIFKISERIAVSDTEAKAIADGFEKIGFDPRAKDITAAEEAVLRSLSSDGKREWIRQSFERAKSPEEAVNLVMRYGDKYKDYVPGKRVVQAGDLETTLTRFGEKQQEYVVRGGNSLWGEKQVLVPKLISDHIDNIDRKLIGSDHKALTKMLHGLDWANSAFKLWVYPLFPGSAFRDSVSNILFNSYRIGAHAIDPALHMDTVRIMAGESGEFISKTGRRYTYDEVRALIDSNNIVQRIEDLTESTGLGSPVSGMTRSRLKDGRVVKRFRKDAGKIPRNPVRGLLRARNAVDNESRVALLVQNLKDGLTVEDASQSVAEYLFHYNEVSPFMREFVRRLFPFATFTQKNIQQKARLLAKNPGMFANRYKPFRGRESENSEMVKWEGEAMKLRLNRDGKTVQVITGIDLPLRNLDFLWRGNMRDTLRSVAGMMTPLVKTPMEWATGKDFFTGKDLSRKDNAMLGLAVEKMNPPQGVKDWLGYKRTVDDAGRPRYSFDGERLHLLTNSWIFSRIVSTTDRQFREMLRDGGFNWAKIALDVGTGVRMKNINMDEQTAKILGVRIRELQRVLARRGVLPEFQVYGRNPEELEQ